MSFIYYTDLAILSFFTIYFSYIYNKFLRYRENMNTFKKFISFSFFTIALTSFTGCSEDSGTVIATIYAESSSSTEDDDTDISSSSRSVKSSSSYNHDPSEVYIGFLDDDNYGIPEPRANVPVRIWSLKDSGLELVSLDTLDELGRVYPDPNLKGFHLVETRSKTGSTMRWIDFDKKIEYPNYLVRENATMKGIIKENGTGIANVTVRVLDKKVVTNSDGEFEIDEIPAGVHFITVKYNDIERVYIANAINDSEKEKFTNKIDLSDGVYTAFDEFADWDSGRTNFGNSFGYGYWFIETDANFDETSKSKIKNKSQYGYSGYFMDDPEQGKTMHIIFDIDENSKNPYGAAGFTIGDDSKATSGYTRFDITGAKAFSFNAKGTGEIFVLFSRFDEAGSQNNILAGPIQLADNWGKLTVSIDSDFNAINSIAIIARDDAEIYFNNPRLEGLSPDKWLSIRK